MELKEGSADQAHGVAESLLLNFFQVGGFVLGLGNDV